MFGRKVGVVKRVVVVGGETEKGTE